jgi:hypothetical protein
MSDTVYNVVTRYTVDDANAAASQERLASGAQRLNSQHEALANRISSVSSTLAGGFDRVVGTVARLTTGLAIAAAAAGMGVLVQGVTRLNADAEDARISIGGMFQAAGAARDFTGALAMSDGIIARMRVHANALPGEFRDLQNVFEGGLLPGLNNGKTADQVEQLSASFMAVSQTFRVDSATAGRELNMMLEGRAGSHIVMWSRLHGLIGKTSQEFNQMTGAQRFEAIQRALGGFGPAIEAYGHSWAAVSSTAKDHLQTMLRIGTQPLFERVKGTLERLNGWFERNQVRIEHWAVVVGDHLANAFTRVEQVVERLMARFRGVSLDSLLHSAVQRAQQLGSALLVARGGLALLSNPNVVGAILRAPGRVGGFLARSGTGLGTGSSGIQYNRGNAIALGVGINETTSSAAGAMANSPGAQGLARAAAPMLSNPYALIGGLAALAAVVVSVAAVFTAFHTHMQSASNVFERLRQATMPVITSFGNVYAAMQPFLDQLGSNIIDGFVTSIGLAARGLALMGNISAWFIRKITYAWDTLAGSRIGQMLGLHTSSQTEGFRPMVDNGPDEGVNIGTLARTLAHARSPEELAAARAAARQSPRGNMNVTVRIEQTINDASDPDRVMIDTRRAVIQALRHPIESHTAPLPVGG